MKPDMKLMAASLLVLSMAACSPSNPTSDNSASVAASTAQSAADNVNPDNAPVPEPEAPVSDTVESSAVASSVAVVIARSTDTYDPAVITEMGRRPGYWEVRHTDPSTHREVTDKVCIDKATGDRLVRDGGRVSAPADHRDIRSTANWLGNCPTDTRAGDVVRHNGQRVNAWNDNRPESHDTQDHDNQNRDTHTAPPVTGHDQNNMRDHNTDGHDQTGYNQSGHDQTGHDQNMGHDSSSASDHGHDQTPVPSHNPHNTPAEGHASSSSSSSWSHDRNTRDHQG